MSLVCPQCNFHRDVGGVARLELCPVCQSQGNEVYLEEVDETPARRRRHDLIGLLAAARGQIQEARAARRRPGGQTS